MDVDEEEGGEDEGDEGPLASGEEGSGLGFQDVARPCDQPDRDDSIKN